MAIGTPTERYTHQNIGSVFSFQFSPASNVASGKRAVLSWGNNGGIKTITGITDSVGNVWGRDFSYAPGNVIEAWSCLTTAAITTGDTITITVSGADNHTNTIFLHEISGLSALLPLDQSATMSATTNAPSCGPTGTLAQADEIAFGLFVNSASRTWAKDAAWTDPATPQLGGLALEHKIVAATTALTATGSYTGGGAVAVIGAVVTYKGLAAVNTVLPAVTGTPVIGQTLTTDDGIWTDDGSPTFSYKWQRYRSGLAYSDIGGATSSTYTLTEADVGCLIRSIVTDSDTTGAASAPSNAAGRITWPLTGFFSLMHGGGLG